MSENSVKKPDLPGADERDRRRASRHDLSQPAGLELNQFSSYVVTIDVSSSGARCRLSSGFAPFEGDTVKVMFVDGTTRSGIVRWTSGQDFGLEFEQELQNPKELLYVECWGGDGYAKLLRFQQRTRLSD